jgi:NADH-quinone oxidoreductase subunit C
MAFEMKHLSERLERVKAAVLPKLAEQLGADGFEAFEHRGELSIRIPRERIVELLGYLRDEPTLRFDMLKDVCVVDWYRRRERFEVVYNLWSITNNLRLRVKCFTEEKAPHVDSVVGLFPGANWYEREAYDMHGVIFDGHPDLRRMYLPEDFVDPNTGEPLYPLRKEFPMMGVPGSMPLPERN